MNKPNSIDENTDLTQIKNEIDYLCDKINNADRCYFIDSSPIMSDTEYDDLYERLKALETQYPHLVLEESPTNRIGSDLDNNLPEEKHQIPVLSLDKAYTISEVNNWIIKTTQKLNRKIELIIEPKIDGAGVVLYYNNGILQNALTRGNGEFGNVITANVKTIRTIPLTINYKGKLAVRGEIYMDKDDFIRYNEEYGDGKYANPRNLASGTVRRLKSIDVASVPLKIFVYEGFFFDNNDILSHYDNLRLLKNNGFRLTEKIAFFTENMSKYASDSFLKSLFTSTPDQISSYINIFTDEREKLKYEIDGLVIKINSISDREELGYTRHHPRWALAYKFNALQIETVVESIDIQIGRGGRITPVANLTPVELSGSVISRATLHNRDYIKQLNLNEGDTVLISKRGEVIPAVESVVSKGSKNGSYQLPDICPSCGSKLVEEGAHLFCINRDCDQKILGSLQFFVSRKQMDIETLGDKTLEFLYNQGIIKSISDIYTTDYNLLHQYDGFKEKKVDNIKKSIEISKQKPFSTVLSSLGFKDIGNKVSELLAENFQNITTIIDIAKNKRCSDLAKINGIGEVFATRIIEIFSDENNIKLISALQSSGLNFKLDSTSVNSGFLNNTKWVVTGAFDSFKPREIASDLIIQNGGNVVGTVSSKTDYLLCGTEPGSKLQKAIQYNIRIINEAEFIEMLNKKEKI